MKPTTAQPLTGSGDPVDKYLLAMDSIPGWFGLHDAGFFRAINSWQRSEGLSGDILEIGCYAGRSAILLGYMIAQNEEVHICDSFGTVMVDDPNELEFTTYYRGVDSERFVSNYSMFHTRQPQMHICLSTSLAHRIAPNSMRFIHVDGAHGFDIVRQDIALTIDSLTPDGCVVFDDFQAPHTPGVAAAVWGESARAGLKPFLLSGAKLYATTREPPESLREVVEDAADRLGLRRERHEIYDREVVRTWHDAPPRPSLPRRIMARALLTNTRRR